MVLACAVAVPAAGAEETRATPGSADLAVECSVPGYQVMSAFVGVDLALERAGKVLVEKSGADMSWELAFVSMPGCRIEPVLPPGIAKRPATIVSATARGDLLYGGDWMDRTGSQYFKRAGQQPITLQPPSDLGQKPWKPVLSDDGSAVVWLVRRRSDNGDSEQSLRVRDLSSGSERSVPLPPSGRMGWEPIAANVAGDEYVLVEFPDKVVVADGNGHAKWTPNEAESLGHVLTSLDFRRIHDGWVAWDSGEDGTARLRWWTPDGSGHHDFPASNVEAVSVTPDASRIAVSVSSSSHLNDQEAVVVIKVSDGKELIHRVLPRYSRVKLGFLDDVHLAMNTKDGIDVLRLPPSLPALQASAIPKPVDVEGNMVAAVRQLGSMVGLTLEDPKPDVAAALVGTWKLVDVGDKKACGSDDPFLEIHPDGSAYDPVSRTSNGKVLVGERYVTIGEPDSKNRLPVFVMSGGFYVPSHECLLMKLERIP